MKKNRFNKIALNKTTISAITGGLDANHANHGDYSDVHSDLVTLPVATNCPTDTFELSCICGGVANTVGTPVDKEPVTPRRN